MSGYIEFDSTYRDRVRFPSAANFEMPISQTGRKQKDQAVDPVCLSTPMLAWTSNAFSHTPSSAAVSGVAISSGSVASATDGNVLIVDAPAAGSWQELDNYYRGAVFHDTTISVRRRIIDSHYLGNDKTRIILESALPDTFAIGNAWTIVDPTDLSALAAPLIYVPGSPGAQNAFAEAFLFNETLNQFRPIKNYNALTHLAELNLTTSAGGTLVGWTATDNYSIRIELPTAVSATVASTTSTITLAAASGASTVDGFYTNDYVRVRAATYGVGIPTAPETETRRIVGYNGATLTLTVTPPFAAAPAVAANNIEILPFTHDNLNPFMYSGSMVSSTEMVSYEVELLNLVLPNRTIETGFNGGNIAFYPYVYVEVTNVTSPGSGIKSVIWSNNPNSKRALFRAAIDDIANPIISQFIKIDGDGMVQTIKFKPNDNIGIRVFLSNGQIYQTTLPDTSAPEAPDPRAQISGVLLCRRI